MLGKQKIVADENMEHFVLLRNGFVDSAVAITESFAERYYEIAGDREFWDKTVQVFAGILELQSEQVCRTLFSLKVYDITQEQLVEKYYEQYFDPEPYIGEISERLQQVEGFAQLRKVGREVKKAARGRWTGAGIGVGGALTGAVIASAFNAAGGLAYSMGNAIANASDQKQMDRIRRTFFRDPETFSLLCVSVYAYAFRAFFALMEEVRKRGIIPPCQSMRYEPEKAKAMRINAPKFAKTREQTFDLLAQSASLDPFEPDLYPALSACCEDQKEVDRFADFFGIKKESEFFRKLDVMAMRAGVEQMPETTLPEQVAKLHSLIRFDAAGKNQGVSAQAAILRLSNRIAADQGESLEKIRGAKRALQKEFGEATEDCGPLLAELDRQEQAILQQQSAREIAKLPVENPDEILKKLAAICVHTKTFSETMPQAVEGLLRRLGAMCVEAEVCQQAAGELTTLGCGEYPQLQTAAEALACKGRGFQKARKTGAMQVLAGQKMPIVFAPVLLDIIEEARKGDAFCQLWLTATLLPEEILTNSLLDAEKQPGVLLSAAEQERISENVGFLFDRPQTYSFDLFMRLRTALWTQEAEDYCEMLRPVADAGDCPAGQYEYGNYCRRLGKPEAGRKALEQVARRGYFPAMRTMRRWTLEAGENGGDWGLYYDILGSGTFGQSLDRFRYVPEAPTEKNQAHISRLLALHQFLAGYRGAGREPRAKSLSDTAAWLQTMGRELGIQNTGKDCRRGFAAVGTGKDADKLLAKLRKRIPAEITGQPVFGFYSDYVDFTLLVTTRELCWHRGNQTQQRPVTVRDRLDIQDPAFSQYYGIYQADLWQIYAVLYAGLIPYGAECQPPVIEKMALCGNPEAICHMLGTEDLSQERRDVWERQKAAWEARGQCFRVCPVCRKRREREDRFCPECGRKLQ